MAPGSSKNARLLMIDKLRANHTHEEIAAAVGVSVRQVARDIAELRSDDKLTKREVMTNRAENPAYRDAVFDATLNTQAEIQWAIRRIKERLVKLEEKFDAAGVEMPEDDGEGKRGRGRPMPPPGLDGVLIGSLFKGYDSLTNQLMLLAKLLGQISDAPQLAIMQIDSDMQMILETLIENGDTGPARRLYNAIIAKSERRARRLPEFPGLLDRIVPTDDAVDGEFSEE